MKILVTGFEPFGGDAENASQLAVRGLADRWTGSAELVTATLPVTFAGAPEQLRALVDRHRPDAVIAVGEAGGRAVITPERYGRNVIEARIPDNDGQQPRPGPIDDGPELRPATLDGAAMVERLRARGFPAELSDDAGAFVCNRVAVELADLAVPGLFLHVPALRSAGRASVGTETDSGTGSVGSSLTVADLASALDTCVAAAVAMLSGDIRSADADQPRHP